MTVILVLLTFAIFLTIDYLRQEKPATQTVQAKAEPAPRLLPSYVAGFELPANVRYHPGHTWALAESPNLVRVGLDDFAARLIGKMDHMDLPKRGQWIRQGQKLATIFRDGAKTELVSPVEGEVTQVNEAALSEPALAAREPYGKGWLVSVFSPDAQTGFRNLLGGNLARSWMAEASARLFARMPAMAGAVAQDGGLAVHDLTAQMPDVQWAEITREFFLM
ncbi:MAG TPA: glycine cleavage system protein H [Candidatus Binatia bacterium]|nr:glycine cleavage system protein H [Candidatus Binatia bacterium]